MHCENGSVCFVKMYVFYYNKRFLKIKGICLN